MRPWYDDGDPVRRSENGSETAAEVETVRGCRRGVSGFSLLGLASLGILPHSLKQLPGVPMQLSINELSVSIALHFRLLHTLLISHVQFRIVYSLSPAHRVNMCIVNRQV